MFPNTPVVITGLADTWKAREWRLPVRRDDTEPVVRDGDARGDGLVGTESESSSSADVVEWGDAGIDLARMEAVFGGDEVSRACLRHLRFMKSALMTALSSCVAFRLRRTLQRNLKSQSSRHVWLLHVVLTRCAEPGKC